jgi:ABC-type multidrug transport system fused ATPase/permease subunit
VRRNCPSRSTARLRGVTRHLIIPLAPYRWRIALTLLSTVLASLLNLPIPLLIRELIDQALADPRPSPRVVAGLLAVSMAQVAVSLFHVRASGPVGLGVVRDLRHRLYSRLQRLGLSYFDRTAAGAILSRLIDDVTAIEVLVSGPNLSILADLGAALAVSGVLFWQAPSLALLALVFVAGQATTHSRLPHGGLDGSGRPHPRARLRPPRRAGRP